MPRAPTILALIRNGTMSAEMAALLWAAVDHRWSFVVTAIPRLAGKTTVMNAMLDLLPPQAPVHHLSGAAREIVHLKGAPTGGYLVVGEISPAPMPTYLWGPSVHQVFETLAAGYSLATALHASSLEETFAIICAANGVPDEQAAHIRLVLYLRRLYVPLSPQWRLARMHLVERVQGGQPTGRLLSRWVEEDDRFETAQAPQDLSVEASALAERTSQLRALVEAARTSPEDVALMVADYSSGG